LEDSSPDNSQVQEKTTGAAQHAKMHAVQTAQDLIGVALRRRDQAAARSEKRHNGILELQIYGLNG
jgi:hypothetical protein